MGIFTSPFKKGDYRGILNFFSPPNVTSGEIKKDFCRARL